MLTPSPDSLANHRSAALVRGGIPRELQFGSPVSAAGPADTHQPPAGFLDKYRLEATVTIGDGFNGRVSCFHSCAPALAGSTVHATFYLYAPCVTQCCCPCAGPPSHTHLTPGPPFHPFLRWCVL
jgi:hypothetical protein